jgi:hypothetical protein
MPMNLSNLYGKAQIGDMLGISILVSLLVLNMNTGLKTFLLLGWCLDLATVCYFKLGDILNIPTDKIRTLKM